MESLTKIFEARPPKRKLNVGASNAGTSKYEVFDEKTPLKDLPVAVASSASIPVVFATQHLYGKTLYDGGAIWNTNLVSAVDRCREDGFEDEQIVLDVVICGHPEGIKQETETGNTIENYIRNWDIAN